MNKKQEIVVRIYIGFLAIVLLGFAIVGRVAFIQTAKGEYYRSLADSLTIFTKTQAAERGNIFTEDGKLLATSIPIFDIHIDFAADGLKKETFNKNVDSVSMLLANLFKDKTTAEYKQAFIENRQKRNGYYLLQRNVSLAQLNVMKTWPWFRLSRNKSGLIIESKEIREHPFGDLALRTLGTDENLDGLYSSGIELKYQPTLVGEEGIRYYRKLSNGASKPLDTKEDISAKSGKDIYTTIDINYQDVAEESLRRALTQHNADHGTVILMEVKTGKIKAIANLGKRDSSIYKELLNYAVGEATEPGSTFKLATMASLMEDGLANKNTNVEINDGELKVKNLTIRDHDRPETPVMNMKRAIEVSSNVAIAKLAYNNYAATPSKFYDHLKKFGFTEAVNVELNGAAKPRLASPKNWSGVSSAYIAHGYELQITPLHTLQFYNAIANGGKMVKPTLIAKVKEYGTTVDSLNVKVVDEKLISERTVNELKEILEGVVENGTAKNLKTDYLKIAGKTGTAVIATGSGYKGNKKYQASFVGYFPAENPLYSMIVVVNSPSNGVYYGNVVAGTIFRDVADKVYSLALNIHAPIEHSANDRAYFALNGKEEDVKNILNGFQLPSQNTKDAEWISSTYEAGKFNTTERIIESEKTPNVIGFGLRDALYLLESKGFRVQFSGVGNVKSQSIPSGEKCIKGQTITIELG